MPGRIGAWANQAMDYALNAEGQFIGVQYEKPTPGYFTGRWFVTPFSSRKDLDDWYQRYVGSPERYHYLAAYDKTMPAWVQGDPIAATGADDATLGVTDQDRLAQLRRLQSPSQSPPIISELPLPNAVTVRPRWVVPALVTGGIITAGSVVTAIVIAVRAKRTKRS